MSNEIIDFLIQNMSITPDIGFKIKTLLDEGYSHHYIFRYCKDMIETADYPAIKNIEKRYKHFHALKKIRDDISAELGEDEKLLPARFKSNLASTRDEYLLEDAKECAVSYIKTVKAAGKICELVNTIYNQNNISVSREEYINSFINPEIGLNTPEMVLAVAYNLLMERILLDPDVRSTLRQEFMEYAVLESKAKKNFSRRQTAFEPFFDYKNDLKAVPSQTFLAIMVGASEGSLYFKLFLNEHEAVRRISERIVKNKNHAFFDELRKAIVECYKTKLFASIQRIVLKLTRRKAESLILIDITNKLRELINSAPLNNEAVITILPALKSSSRIAVVDKEGSYIEDLSIHPFFSLSRAAEAKENLLELIKKYDVNYIAIAGEQGSIELYKFVSEFKTQNKLKNLNVFIADRIGSSVYPETKIADAEFPNSDYTIRYLISIARKLQNPLMEISKLPPAKIYLNPFQKDIKQTRLEEEMKEVFAEKIAETGVNINKCNEYLAAYIPGFNSEIASKIRKHIETFGNFKKREDIKQIPRLSEKAFKEAAGFILIHESSNPLDSIFIHPDNYTVVKKISEGLLIAIPSLIKNRELTKTEPSFFATNHHGVFTVKAIIQELLYPVNSSLIKSEIKEFTPRIKSADEIKLGMILDGMVANIVDFGIFLDIGIEPKALVHVSEIPANSFFDNLHDFYYFGQILKAKVIQLDKDKKRINLSLKRL